MLCIDINESARGAGGTGREGGGWWGGGRATLRGSSEKGREEGGSLGRLEVLPATLPLGVTKDSSSSLSLPKGSCLQHMQTAFSDRRAKCDSRF